ncbi:hypothetical protein ABBQ38_002663 [Trebouxia sp. C0009 RCD-2024]
MMPGAISWTSPSNHVGVHPESLLYHRDPEQLAADVIGLSERYAALANEHKLQKVQISKLSSSLSRERAEAAELSEIAEFVGMPSSRRRAGASGSRAGSRPGSAFRSPCRPQSRPTSARLARDQFGGSMPEWVLSDLQERLNAAQQLLDNRSTPCNQGYSAGTWPRARPRSPPGRGGRSASSHISLDPNSRLADAFAIYGVPRGITQYMSRKWTQPSPRGGVVNLASPVRRRSSLIRQQQLQLQEKVAAVKKASHVILLEAMQLRAHFPPAVSVEEHEALGPHLDALINLLHSHSLQVQDELRMLPGFNASGMEQSSSPSQQHNYSSSSRSVVHPSYPPAQPPPREGDPRQDSPFLPSDSEEDSSFIAADDDPADEEEAAAAVDDNTPESAVEAAAEGAGHVTASSEEEAEKGSAAADESTSAGEDSNEYRGVPQKLSEEDLGMHIQSLERQSAEAMTKAAESVTAAAEAVTKASHHQIQSVPAGSAIPDEYLRRMHMSSRTPLPGGLSTPTPPQGAPAGSNVPRRWTKNNSYPDGSSGSHRAWETCRGGSFKGPEAPEAPVDVMTYDDSSSGHVAPVSAESALAAFNDACGDSFHRREDVHHPAMHIGKSGGALSPEAQHTKGQQPHSRVTNGNDEQLEALRQAPSRQLSTADSVVSQGAPRQLSTSNSSTNEVAESAQGQPEADLCEEEHLKMSDASGAGQETESAEDDYADEFELDEPVADLTATRLPPQALYGNPQGDEAGDGCEDDSAGGHMHPPADASHVKTQLSVADESEYVKVQWSLDVSKDEPQEEEDEEEAADQGSSGFSKMPATPHPKKKSIFSAMTDDVDVSEDEHMRSADASTWVPRVHTQLRVPEGEGEPVKVQWSLDVSEDEPEDDEEEGNDQGKGSFSKMPSTPFPRKSIFSAMADDSNVEGEEEPVKVQWSLDVSKDEPEDEEEEGNGHGKGRFPKMPSTPFPRKSIFSASGNMADDVDIFSTTLPNEDSGSESAAESDIGGSLPQGSSDVRQDSAGESSMQLTPSYRQTQRHSLQQAADNEQPFATSWRPQPAPAQEADAPSLAPTTASQTPSRHSTLVPGQDTASEQGMQSSLSTAGTSVPAKPAGSNEAAAALVPATLPSHASLPVQFSLETLVPGSLSRQPSCLTQPASGVSSRRSSYSARVEREASQLLGSRQVSNAASMNATDQQPQGVSRTASLTSGANTQLGPVLSSRVLAPQAADAESNRTASKRSSFSKPASLSRESSQISRQVSGGKAAAAVAASSAASSRTASRQPSFSSTAVLNRSPVQVSHQQSMSGTAAAVVPSPAASLMVSRQASLTHPASVALSRQASYISRQPSSASAAAAVAAAESVNRPASATRQNSQRQVNGDAVMVSRTGPRVSPSGSSVPSRQQSFAARSPPGIQDAYAHDVPVTGQLSGESSSVSRTKTTSSQPRRSNSLDAMHQQMGMSRKAPAVGSVAPAPVVRRLSNDKAVNSGFRAHEGWQPSNAASEVNRTLAHQSGVPDLKQGRNDVEVMSNHNSSVPGEHTFESSHDHDGRSAAEKHAYLHSQHGMDDTVF